VGEPSSVCERARATDGHITEGGAVDAFPLGDVAVVRCANFTFTTANADVLGERLRLHLHCLRGGSQLALVDIAFVILHGYL
jgi:hypothetical protein